MANVTAREQTALEQRLVHSDHVFARLASVLSWIEPAVRGNSNQVAGIRLAPERWAPCWHELLPDERERALDRVISSFCDLETGVEGWKVVLFRDVKVDARRSTLWHNNGRTLDELKLIGLEVNEIVKAAQPADVDRATSFRDSILGPNGITAAKLRRMQTVEWEHCAEELETSLERLRAGTSAARALPPVDCIFVNAHNLVQTPEERLTIFTRCVDDILKLYHEEHLPHMSHEQHLDYLRDTRSILLSPTEAASFVRALSPDRQLGAIKELCSAVMVDIDPSTIRPPSQGYTDLPANLLRLDQTVRAAQPGDVDTSRAPHPHAHENRSLGVSTRSPFFPLSRRSPW
ncbi:hypothetical protein JCM8208_005268 [Rhodotorula glutinis]